MVERCQGVLGKWTEFHKCGDTRHLQGRLDQEGEFYNYHFPIRRLKGRKRIEVFPRLAFTGRSYRPGAFRLQRALDFLAQGNWNRKVSSGGQVRIYDHRFSVGLPYKHQHVNISICPKQNAWQVFNATGNLIKQVPTRFSKQSLCRLDLL